MMATLTDKELASYSNKHVINQILGAVMQNPKLVQEHGLKPEDFPERLHHIIFTAINNLITSGAKELNSLQIEEYIRHYDIQYEAYKKGNGPEFLKGLAHAAVPRNFAYQVDQLKKFSLLRAYKKQGIDVSSLYDPNEVDPVKRETQRKKFDAMSCTDILNHFRSIQLDIAAPYKLQQSGDSKKAGEGGIELLEHWKENVAWGIGYSSAYLTEIFHGMRPTMFTVKSAGTGVGKTRTALADMAYACSPHYYDSSKEMWMRNPNGMQNKALYIGTEMELGLEIDPILWAYIADVPQDHIKYNEYLPGEEERVRKAIQILKDEGNIWLEYRPEITCATLEDIIEEHVVKHGVQYVWFDYIHLNPVMIAEYVAKARGIAGREDMVLLDLSSNMKRMCRDYNICLHSATQVNGSIKDDGNRDQSVISGSKAIVNKCDNALIAMPPTARELELVAPIIEELNITRNPNLIYTVYKVRDGKWNKVKVWLNVEYATMRTHDLFVTREDYTLIPDLRKTYINVESQEVASDNKSFLDPQLQKIARDLDEFGDLDF